MSTSLALLAAAQMILKGEPAGSAKTRRALAEFADCVIRSAPKKSRKIVLGELPVRVEDENYHLIENNCVPPVGNGDWTMIRLEDVQLRFQLADAFIRKDPSLDLPPLEGASALKHDVAERADTKPETRAFAAAISRFGECVVRAAPAAATRLVRSEIASEEEDDALQAMKPALSSCLSAGQTFTFSPEVVRGSVALNFYRLATAGGIQ